MFPEQERNVFDCIQVICCLKVAKYLANVPVTDYVQRAAPYYYLDSSVGRALHRYRRSHGFESRSGLFSGFNLTTAQVVCITAMVNHAFMYHVRVYHGTVVFGSKTLLRNLVTI